MRALNPTTIGKLNTTTKTSQRKQKTGDNTTSEVTSTNGPPYPLNAATTSGPRPSSRQSTVSSSFSTTSGGSSKTGFRRFASFESLATKHPKSRPTIITKTVTKSSRVVSDSAAIVRNKALANNHLRPVSTQENPSPPPTSSRCKSQSQLEPSPSTKRRSLNSRNENATKVIGTVSPSSSSATSMSRNVKVTMPYDRSSNPNGGRLGPHMPTLSAGATRALNKPALTPKIATKSSQGPILAANAHTPLPKRTLRPGTGNVATPVPSRSTPVPDDEPPVFLGNNITPRSGKRQSRVDSANSTPSGTPTHDAWDRDARGARAVSPAPTNNDSTRRPVVTFGSNSSMPAKHELKADLDSKFFHASEVKSTQPPPSQQQQKHTLAKAPSFFYANGNKVDKKPNTPASVTSVPSQISSQDTLSSKFVYANGTPDLKPSPPLGISRPSSVVSMASRAPSSRPTSTHANGIGSSQRPVSPAKSAQPSHVTQSKNAALPSVASRPQLASAPSLVPSVGLRRTSTGTSISRAAHSRNSSGSRLSMGESEMKHAFIPSGPSSPLATPSLASPMHAPLSLASIIQAAEEFGDDESIASPDGSRSDVHPVHEVQSPTKSAHSGDPLGDLVANARRERKVQDLQITNASLEAINRTLERQLRKQTAELRRFRRMSRVGGLSALSSVASSRVVSDAHSVNPGIEGLSLSDLDEEASEDEFEEEDSFTDSDSANESLSPSIIAERDARRMKRDEKRLQLDLSKHQELLIDSQKINQSIKRCMDWTEELIKEGKKALEYNVRVSDVEIPRPRVLNSVDDDEEPTQTSINFDADATMDDISMLIDEGHGNSERIMPLEPRLAGWKPEQLDSEGSVPIVIEDG